MGGCNVVEDTQIEHKKHKTYLFLQGLDGVLDRLHLDLLALACLAGMDAVALATVLCKSVCVCVCVCMW